MQTYVILYRPFPDTYPANPPQSAKVEGLDSDATEETFIADHPGVRVAWLWEGSSVQEAYDDYYAGCE